MASSVIVGVPGSKPVGDLEIQEWIHRQYGFVPHPYWISHCKELYIDGARLSAESRPAWHECPQDKRLAIKEAFLCFGMLSE